MNPRRLYCECQNCGEHWSEPRDGYGPLRCTSCGSKNVDIEDPDDTESKGP
jgi:Zn finger protein HypA/HybF involved in hydrogenase expression